MKRLFLLFALCALAVSACEPINSGGDDNTTTSAIKITSNTEISVGKGSAMGIITYTINNPVVGASVEAESDKEWVNSFDYSQMGKIGYKVDANPTYEDRIANINISYDGKVVATLSLKQAGKERPKEIKVEAPHILGHYYGDYAGYNYNYYLVLSESGYAANDEFNSEGYKYFLDIYSNERPADYSNIRVPNGVYTFNVHNDGQAGTFLESFSIYKEYDNSGVEIAEHPYSEGVLIVTDDLVKLEVKFEGEENLYVVTFAGDYSIQDRRGEAGGIY